MIRLAEIIGMVVLAVLLYRGLVYSQRKCNPQKPEPPKEKTRGNSRS